MVGGLATVVIGFLGMAPEGGAAPRKLEDLSLEELLETAVSPARQPQRVTQAPAIVYVLSGAELRRSGVLSLAEALDRLPGLTMARLPDGARQPVVRGAMSTDGVLVMIDGVPVNDDLDGSFHFYGLDLAD